MSKADNGSVHTRGRAKRIWLRTLQTAVIALSAAMLIWVCIPGIAGAGTLLGVILFAGLGTCAVLAGKLREAVRRLWRSKAGRAAFCAAAAAAAAFLGICCYNGAMMAVYSSVPLSEVKCVMILGCQVKGSEPGIDLEARLSTALPLIRENDTAAVVVCGGMGRGENITEAECMKRWLVSNGVNEGRIYTEDSSRSTAENFDNAAPILDGLAISDGIAVVTSGYHQYRAELNARRLGISVGHYPAATRPAALANHIIREMAAIFFA